MIQVISLDTILKICTCVSCLEYWNNLHVNKLFENLSFINDDMKIERFIIKEKILI